MTKTQTANGTTYRDDRSERRNAGRGGTDANELRDADFSSEKMGRNSLQGDDQENVHNQRRAVPEQKSEPDEDVIDSFKKMDKDVRARRDLGKKEQ